MKKHAFLNLQYEDIVLLCVCCAFIHHFCHVKHHTQKSNRLISGELNKAHKYDYWKFSFSVHVDAGRNKFIHYQQNSNIHSSAIMGNWTHDLRFLKADNLNKTL
jgi:hypothetical protein